MPEIITLDLNRQVFSNTETLGSLIVKGKHFCYTLEDTVRAGAKIHGQTAIPAGRYEVKLTMSNRFKRIMPELIDVPGFKGVRLHGGNTNLDTEGCPLVAFKQYKNKPHPVYTKILNWIQGSAEKNLTALIAKYDKCYIFVK